MTTQSFVILFNFAMLSVKPKDKPLGCGARYKLSITGNMDWDSLKIEIQKVAHVGHTQKWSKIHVFRDISQLWPITVVKPALH